MCSGEKFAGVKEEEETRQNLRGNTAHPEKWHLYPDDVHYVF